MRDWLNVTTETNQVGRVLLKTPHEIGVIVAHRAIHYGTFIETMQDGYILKMLKRAVFRSVRDAVAVHSSPAPAPHRSAEEGKS